MPTIYAKALARKGEHFQPSAAVLKLFRRIRIGEFATHKVSSANWDWRRNQAQAA
jgi:hypothetical protein